MGHPRLTHSQGGSEISISGLMSLSLSVSDGIWSVSSMVRHHISKEYKDIALHLSLNEGLPDLQIQTYIGISPHSMRRLQQTWREKGVTTVKPVITGWPQLLDALNASVCCTTCILSRYKSIIIPICSLLKAWLSGSLTCQLLNCRNFFMSFAMSTLRFQQSHAHCIGEDTLWNVYFECSLPHHSSRK